MNLFKEYDLDIVFDKSSQTIKIIQAEDKAGIFLIPYNSTLTKEIMEFSFKYLIDFVRILIFFENYMKAELIVKGFTIHLIKKEDLNFKSLAKEQISKPITVKEIAAIKIQ